MRKNYIRKSLTNIAKITILTRIKTEKKEAKKGPEMSANIAKIGKVTRIFHAT